MTHKGPDISACGGVGDKRVICGGGPNGHFVEQVERDADAVGRTEIEKEDGVGKDGVSVKEADAKG